MIFKTWSVKLTLIAIAVLSYATYLRDVDKPQLVYWDEHYHVASAQRYLNHKYFMELHPPLGKLLMALGEHIVGGVQPNDQFIAEMNIPVTTTEFSMLGYRLFPALLSSLTPLVIFATVLLYTGGIFVSTFAAALFIFDNAMVVHFRAAMLDGVLVFFSALSIFAYVLLRRGETKSSRLIVLGGLLGLALAGAATTKALGLILFLLIPAAFIKLLPSKRSLMVYFSSLGAIFFTLFVAVWQIHFSLASTVIPGLDGDGFFGASEKYKEILAAGETNSLLNFPLMLKDSIAYAAKHGDSVPRLNLCKDPEDGSPFYFWPLAARSIDYAREQVSEKAFRYLYLQANPFVWLIGLCGVLAAAVLLAADFIVGIRSPLRNKKEILLIFLMYLCFMIAVSRIERVMYLYHYFIPLTFSLLLAALVLAEIFHFEKFTRFRKLTPLISFIAAGILVASFVWYSPFTYYHPITNRQMKQRRLLDMWDLRCHGCARTNHLAQPLELEELEE